MVLLSNFLTECGGDEDVTVIINSIGDIELIAVSDTVQYEDTENLTGCHFTQSEEKGTVQTKSEKVFADMISQIDGANLCHIDYVESQLLYYQRKAKRPFPWNCALTIGSEFSINIAAYVYIKDEPFFESFKTECLEANTFTKLTTTYRRNNEEIDKPEDHDLVRAFMYGKQVCPVDDDMKYDGGKKCLSCIAFCRRTYIPPKFYTGEGCHLVLPQPERKKSAKLFAALVTAMINRNYLIVARKLYRDNTKPHLVVLVPHQEEAGMYLTMMELPYDEDVIYTQFPALRNEKYKTSADQAAAMDELLNKMDLMNAVEDESGISEHIVSLNPVQQHMCNAVAFRALNPGEPLPPFNEELLKLFDVPYKIKKESQNAIDEIEKLFKLEIVREKIKKPFGQKTKGAAEDPDGDIQMESENLSEKKTITKIGTVTPAEDFLFLVKYGSDRFSNLCDQIQNIIYDYIFKVTTDYTDKAIETTAAYREIAKVNGPFQYNNWVRELKETMIKRNKIDEWHNIFTKEGLGLISIDESPISTISMEDQLAFYEVSTKNTNSITTFGGDGDADELAELLG